LRTASREFFSSLYQDRLISLQSVYAARSDKGLKSPAEDTSQPIAHEPIQARLKSLE